ncbi:hypothetical protein N7523_002824 [Penicillium sp. IBT 18751x]|nr:hypothetical protein N7523_002824 [Penicillium sp. IBT 18751x]
MRTLVMTSPYNALHLVTTQGCLQRLREANRTPDITSPLRALRRHFYTNNGRNFNSSSMKRLNKMTSTGTVENPSPSYVNEIQETLSSQFDLQEDKAIAMLQNLDNGAPRLTLLIKGLPGPEFCLANKIPGQASDPSPRIFC